MQLFVCRFLDCNDLLMRKTTQLLFLYRGEEHDVKPEIQESTHLCIIAESSSYSQVSNIQNVSIHLSITKSIRWQHLFLTD